MSINYVLLFTLATFKIEDGHMQVHTALHIFTESYSIGTNLYMKFPCDEKVKQYCPVKKNIQFFRKTFTVSNTYVHIKVTMFVMKSVLSEAKLRSSVL